MIGYRLARVGGVSSIGVSLILAVLLATVAHAGFNLANVGALLAGAAGGGLAIAWPDRRRVVGFGGIIAILGMVPALLGGVGLPYLPSVICLGASAALRRNPLRTTSGRALHPN